MSEFGNEKGTGSDSASLRGSVWATALALGLAFVVATLPAAAGASYPGKNGRIFFLARDAAGVRQVFSVNPRGRDRRRITSERFGVLSLAVSPRGERIAYTRASAAGEVNIFSARGRDGKARRKLTSIPVSRGFANSPTFSANGRLIAYEMIGPLSFRSERLMVMGSNGRGKRVLVSTPASFYLEDPAFSPNGRRVAYTKVLAFDVANKAIETARVSDGRGKRVVAEFQADDDKSFSQPDYSPNGERVVFVSNPAALLNNNLLMNTAAAGRAVLRPLEDSRFDTDFSHPVYSPDGRRILAVETSRSSATGELVRLNGDGSGRSRVLRAELLDYPVWVRR